ncbi:MAG: GNAT family N-acetyltransferase [Oscillospiraceae bacterium]|nr:GNAT family N-acetyltransferase [Oscillospiraceae bacterium]
MTIRPVAENELPAVLDVIHRSFATVAKDFGLTRENCPNHTSFLPMEKLQNHFAWGWIMFGLYENDELIGYFSLSEEKDGAFELHNLSVLPEHRHKGAGKLLLRHAAETVRALGGRKITIGIIDESEVLKSWYASQGFIYTGAKKFAHLPFTAGYMEWVL